MFMTVLRRVAGVFLRGLRSGLPDRALLFVGKLLLSFGQSGSACRFYESYVSRRPGNADALLLYANCLRDAGHYSSALRTYGELQSTASTNPTVWIELGKLHLLLDEAGEAMSCFGEAYKLGNRDEAVDLLTRWGFSPDAVNERRNIGGTRPTECFFDVTDVLLYLETHSTVSGIQRVVINLFETLDGAPDTPGSRRQRFCWLDPSCSTLREVPVDCFRRVLSEIERGGATRLSLAFALSACRNGQIIEFVAGDTLVILGAFWISPAYSRVLFELRGHDVQIGVFLYDLLPVTNPEFFEPDLVDVFARALPEVLMLSDFALTISEYTRGQVAGYARMVLNREIPVRAVPLAHELKSFGPRGRVAPDVQKICRTRFALCVGTIEVRKNHRFLLGVWEELLRERGAENIPYLVIVGRWGWKVEELKRELEQNGSLAGKVIILSGVGDAGLSELYRHALFTVFPSVAEGWGLPIGESLAHGTPCIASETTAMPEVGGDFVTYIDPRDRESLRRAILTVIEDPRLLTNAAERIRTGFQSRSWLEFGRDFECALLAVQEQVTRHDTYAAMELGRVYAEPEKKRGEGGRLSSRGLLGMSLVHGWGLREDILGWATSRNPVIRFLVLGSVMPRVLRVAVRLELPSKQRSVSVRVTSGSLTSAFQISGTESRWYFVDAEVGAGGRVELVFDFTGPVLQADAGNVRYVKCTGMCAVDASAALKRVELLEVIYQEPNRP